MRALARSALFLSFLGVLLGIPACKGGPELTPEQRAAKLKRDLDEGDARFRNNKIEDAERIYLRILEEYPDEPSALAGLSQVRATQGDWGTTEVLLKKSLTLRPDHARTHFLLGETLRLTKRHVQAAEPYGKAWQFDPENGDYGLAYGIALKAGKKFSEAEQVFRKVGEIDPNAQFVWSELGDVVREQGRIDEALRLYMKAQTTYQSDKMARAGAAMVYEAKGDIKHALDEWSAYIRMDCCSEYSNSVAKKKIEELQVIEAPADGAQLPSETGGAAGPPTQQAADPAKQAADPAPAGKTG